ncbi:MAG: hypothetical protein C4522_16575 [Desulfobacteraceae bacterium]|nr:MAG: hypothetical protein C4522_16575 [Desulfobacteraceae bacterium]
MMKNIYTYLRKLLILLGFGLLCLVADAYSEQGSFLDQIKQSAPLPKDVNQNELDQNLPRQAVKVEMKYQGGDFWTESRKDKVERYPCYACHNSKPEKSKSTGEMVHGDILLDHGGAEKPLACATCHVKDSPHFLKTAEKDNIDMDHSYDLCGQCHFRQKQDWIGGAHGKRVSNWAGKRVVKNCTACHNPHSPLFQKRWPTTYSPPISK